MKNEPRDSAGKALRSTFLGMLAICGSIWIAGYAWYYGITAYAHWLVGN